MTPILTARFSLQGYLLETVVFSVATTEVGRANGTFGVTGALGDDGADEPALPTPETVNVYDVPFVNPDTVIGLDVPVTVIFPGLDLTTNEVAFVPFGVNETIALWFPATALTFDGINGIGTGVTALVGNEEADTPNKFDAVTVNV